MNEQPYRQKALEASAFLKEIIRTPVRIGVFAGTGLGNLAASMNVRARIAYREIPHFPVSTVEGHMGRLLHGTMADTPVIVMQGRFHLYEGYSPREVAFPVRVMQEMGVNILIITNAAGGFNPAFQAGDIMLITDHINLTGENPLVGANEDAWGLRFPDMSAVYDVKLRRMAREAGDAQAISVKSGVYAGLKGPSLETPAEIRFLKIIGADAVGFSTVQEAVTGVHAGMRILGISIITNISDPAVTVPATVEDILRVAREAAPKLEAILQHVVSRHDLADG